MPPAAISLRPSARERAARLLRRVLAALGDPFLAERLVRRGRRAGPTAAGLDGATRAAAVAAALARQAAYSPQPSRRRASRATRSCANSSSSCWRPARDIETSVS